MFKARWEYQYGFCDVEKVRAVNKDGSPGYIKVSRYVSKYIAKPAGFIPWLEENLCERPRRMSSMHFGFDGVDLEALKRFYTAPELSGKERLERIVERKKSLTVSGIKFPFPRRLQEKIYYEKVNDPLIQKFDYEKKKYVPYTKLTRNGLSRMVLAYERSTNTEGFIKQLYRDSERYRIEVDRSAIAARQMDDEGSLIRREEIASKNLARQLARDSR